MYTSSLLHFFFYLVTSGDLRQFPRRPDLRHLAKKKSQKNKWKYYCDPSILILLKGKSIVLIFFMNEFQSAICVITELLAHFIFEISYFYKFFSVYKPERKIKIHGASRKNTNNLLQGMDNKILEEEGHDLRIKNVTNPQKITEVQFRKFYQNYCCNLEYEERPKSNGAVDGVGDRVLQFVRRIIISKTTFSVSVKT